MMHSHRSSSPGLPISTKPTSSYTSRRSTLSFFGTAAITGIVFHLLFVGLGGNDAVRDVPVLKNWIPPSAEVQIIREPCPNLINPTQTTPSNSPTPRPVPPIVDTTPLRETPNDMTLEELRAMVSKTKGYFSRDFSLGLGWNNVRYIIEQALVQGTLLNRTVVLPSFVYARSCEWEIYSCAAFAPMVNRGDAIGWQEWRHLPIEKQMGWRVPLDVMIDLPHLRKTHNVLLISEYLRLKGMDPNIEWSNGAWHRTDYLGDNPKATLQVVPNGEYDPSTILRVDNKKALEAAGVSSEGRGPVYQKLVALQGTKSVLDWQETRVALADHLKDSKDDAELEKLLADNGYATLHTFAGALGMDYLKSVVEPIKQVAPLSRLRGWVDDYDQVDADILVLEGETHLGRKPGGMRFTTVSARDDFARAVLHSLHPVAKVRDLAQKIYERMRAKVDGRMWMAAHMRRGDFVTIGWAMEKTLQGHFQRIKDRLSDGRQVLETIVREQKIDTFDVPDVVPDQSLLALPPPNPNDPFFLATDEREPQSLKYIKENGGVLIGDLLTVEDRQQFGWPIMLTDVLALVEQAVMSKGHYFYAHAMSSVAGGAVNMRAARGVDPRTTRID
ncbi:hypothetical protein FRB99_003664 [Tulasnella sp. 403]|nr:hypothetical protein FRB99_003664 [Tulasnella sp. 403]